MATIRLRKRSGHEERATDQREGSGSDERGHCDKAKAEVAVRKDSAKPARDRLTSAKVERNLAACLG